MVWDHDVVVVDSSNEREGINVLIVSISGSANIWVLGTGASYYITSSKELFTSFKEWKGSVHLGDDEELSVEDSGSV